MRRMGLQGVVRGKPVRTTVSDKAGAVPARQVNRQFQAPRPNELWVSDFTYVATWQGFVYVAFVIDAFARRIVGWRVSRPRMPASSSTRWSRRSTSAGPSRAAASSITATVSMSLASVLGRPDPHSDRPVSVAGAARRLGVA